VLKAGLSAISDTLGTQGLTTFPRRPSGVPVLTRQGFFERLLTKETLLQNCSNTDVTAAEGDVKHLSLEQLLWIRCQQFETSKGAAAQPKERFLRLVDRAAVGLLSQRLLHQEAALADVQRALLMRHVVLIYGANEELQELGDGTGLESAWWLLSVAGKRYYLHLPRCEVKTSAPEGAVWCFRSHTAPDPRDPSQSRSFKWQVLLVTEPETWLEDPLSTEQRTKTRSSMVGRDQKSLGIGEGSWQNATTGERRTSSGKQVRHKESMLDLFGDFDVEDLFQDWDDELDGGPAGKLAPAKSAGVAKHVEDDMDDFFDSLMSDALLPSKATKSAAPTVMAQATERAADPHVEPREEAAAKHDASTTDTPATIPSSASAESATSSSNFAQAGGLQGDPDVQHSDAEEEAPPANADEAQLREVVTQFYQERRVEGKLQNVVLIAQRYAGDRVPELWAQLAMKYGLPPPTAVQWLAKSLGPTALVQWPKESVPESARAALAKASQAAPSALASMPAEELQTMLEEGGHIDGVRALASRCSVEQEFPQRALLWQTLLEWPPGLHAKSQVSLQEAAESKLGPSAADIKERRVAYKELTARVDADSAGDERSAALLTLLRAEVDADAKAFHDEAFLQPPEVLGAVTSIVLTYAWRCSRYIRGTWDMVALLLFVMASHSKSLLEDAEADTFWCFSQLMAEVEDLIALDTCLVAQVHRVESLLKVYDPPVADLLADHGLAALPVLRLGAMLFTRAGFSLSDCARMWDAMIADPLRFEFVDYIIIALLLTNRGKLLEHSDVGGLAEVLLGCPKQADIRVLLQTAYAVCAFERRCSSIDAVQFPPRPAEAGYGLGFAGAQEAREALAPALEAASAQLSALWGKVKATGAEAWEAAPAAAAVRESVKQAAATAATAAGSAATKASAALEEMQTVIAARVEEERERRKREEEQQNDQLLEAQCDVKASVSPEVEKPSEGDAVPPQLVELPPDI